MPAGHILKHSPGCRYDLLTSAHCNDSSEVWTLKPIIPQMQKTAAHERSRSAIRIYQGRDGNFGAGVGAELDTYAAVTSSLALNGSFSATGPFSVKSITMSVAGEYRGQAGELPVLGSPVLANDTQ